MEPNYPEIERHIDAIPSALTHTLQQDLSKRLDKCGLYYRIFSRCKTGQSAVEKIKLKEYPRDGRLMQDLIGVRVVLYFKDDIDVCISIIGQSYQVIETVRDEEQIDTFHPVRLNLVCRMPDSIAREFDPAIWEHPVDKTFEIQIRTIFSEGWHEIEHDLRYKRKKDWENFPVLGRNLNGIFAVLETCDWSILKILDELAYEKYKGHDWESMLRNHFRLRVDHSELDYNIISLLDRDPELAKSIFRADRTELLLFLSKNKMAYLPKKINNIVYIVNALLIGDERLLSITPPVLKKQVDEYRQSLIGVS